MSPSASSGLVAAGVEMIEAGLAEGRAERARQEARLHLLRAAAALEHAGLYDDALPIIAEVRRLQAAEEEG